MAAKKPKSTRAVEAPDEASGFRGFGSQALPFLRALKENNEREWFAENKSIFIEECDTPLRELVLEVGRGLAAKGFPLAPMAKNLVFRIYRDVRFSRDKSPYKTNLGAALYRDGDKSRPGLLYLHVEPGGSFLAVGFYQPEKLLLKALRQAVSDDPAGFGKVVKSLEAQGLKLAMGDPLVRMPKGFESFADSPFADVIRFRSFVISRHLADDDFERRDLPATVVKFAEEALPLLQYFWART